MSELLTREQVEALPEGTRVVITWSGGNGPHEYVIARDTYVSLVEGTHTGR